jgi:hypothetical protein
VSRVAELGQQWFGDLGHEPVLSLVTDLHQWVLLLWGRRRAHPSRICSQAGPDALGRLPDYSAAAEPRRPRAGLDLICPGSGRRKCGFRVRVNG